MSFVVELWDSIFTPGTTPALIKATHASFIALLLTLIGLLIATWNYHFAILITLASCLWAAITWFISEVEQEKKRQANAKLEGKAEIEQKADKTENTEKTAQKVANTSTSTSASSSNKIRSRKA